MTRHDHRQPETRTGKSRESKEGGGEREREDEEGRGERDETETDSRREAVRKEC
jgi:hypothetical protein